MKFSIAILQAKLFHTLFSLPDVWRLESISFMIAETNGKYGALLKREENGLLHLDGRKNSANSVTLLLSRLKTSSCMHTFIVVGLTQFYEVSRDMRLPAHRWYYSTFQGHEFEMRYDTQENAPPNALTKFIIKIKFEIRSSKY